MPQDGKHLFEAGWNPEEERAIDFIAEREIDLGETEEERLDKALFGLGYDRMQRAEIMQSTADPPGWRQENFRAGSKFYALTTVVDDEHGAKSPSSPFWLSANEVERLEAEKLIDRKNRTIQAAIIKDRYAIPCSNRVNGLVEAVATKDLAAVSTAIGEARDLYTVDQEERSRWMKGGGRQWHPDLADLDLDRSRKNQRLAADYRSFEILYSAADLPTRSEKELFGAAVEASHKALGESRLALAREEYAQRQAEMEGHADLLAKEPALIDGIRDGLVRKIMQERLRRREVG